MSEWYRRRGSTLCVSFDQEFTRYTERCTDRAHKWRYLVRDKTGKDVASGHRRSLALARSAAEAIGRLESDAPPIPCRVGPRPIKRSDCQSGPRPCPWAECRWHLGFKGTETCCLDVASRGGQTHRQIARAMGVSRELVTFILDQALDKLFREMNEGMQHESMAVDQSQSRKT